MAQTIVFLILAAIILGCAFMAVTTRRIMRAATYLIFVLFGTAGLYFLMGYTFLGLSKSWYMQEVSWCFIFLH